MRPVNFQPRILGGSPQAADAAASLVHANRDLQFLVEGGSSALLGQFAPCVNSWLEGVDRQAQRDVLWDSLSLR